MKVKKLSSLIMVIVTLLSVGVITVSATYWEWNYTGSKNVYTYKEWYKSTKISRQDLASYVYHHPNDTHGSKAYVQNYAIKNGQESTGYYDKYSCYCTATMESSLGKVIESSGRQYGWVWSEAETGLYCAVAHTYCGNDAGY